MVLDENYEKISKFFPLGLKFRSMYYEKSYNICDHLLWKNVDKKSETLPPYSVFKWTTVFWFTSI